MKKLVIIFLLLLSFSILYGGDTQYNGKAFTRVLCYEIGSYDFDGSDSRIQGDINNIISSYSETHVVDFMDVSLSMRHGSNLIIVIYLKPLDK